MTLHVLVAMLRLSIGARGVKPCYDCCRVSAHAAAERRRHSYLRGLYHDSISTERRTRPSKCCDWSYVRRVLERRAGRVRTRARLASPTQTQTFTSPPMINQPSNKRPLRDIDRSLQETKGIIITMSKLNSALPCGHIASKDKDNTNSMVQEFMV